MPTRSRRRGSAPNHPTSGPWRWLRAVVFSGVAAQISIAGHLLGGGDVPDLPLLLALTVLLCAVVSGLARRRSAYLVLLATMGVTQVVFHLALTLNAHSHAGPDAARMWVFHAVAAAASAAVLSYGDRVLFSVTSWFARLVSRPPGSQPLPAARPAPTLPDTTSFLTGDPWLSAAPRRGPPAGLVPA